MIPNDDEGGDGLEVDYPRCKKKKEGKKTELPIVRVRYADNIYFENVKPDDIQVSHREAWGLLYAQTNDAILLLTNRSLNPQEFEQADLATGLCIWRPSIIELLEIPSLLLDNLTSDVPVGKDTEKK